MRSERQMLTPETLGLKLMNGADKSKQEDEQRSGKLLDVDGYLLGNFDVGFGNGYS
jgi:hypothetical protein